MYNILPIWYLLKFIFLLEFFLSFLPLLFFFLNFLFVTFIHFFKFPIKPNTKFHFVYSSSHFIFQLTYLQFHYVFNRNIKYMILEPLQADEKFLQVFFTILLFLDLWIILFFILSNVLIFLFRFTPLVW